MDRPLPWGVSLVLGEEHGIHSTGSTRGRANRIPARSAGCGWPGRHAGCRAARPAAGRARSGTARSPWPGTSPAGNRRARSPAADRLSPPSTTASSRSGPYRPNTSAAASAAARSAVGGLVLPAAGEAVLRPAARRAAAVHRPAARLGVDQPGRRAREHAGRITAQADQQDADRAVRGGMRRERLGGRAHRARDSGRQRRERRVALGRGPVRGRERDRHAGLAGRHRLIHGGAAVTLREGDDPGHQPFWRNLHPATAACGRILHYAVPHRSAYAEPFYIRSCLRS